jgi:hypothetical protein
MKDIYAVGFSPIINMSMASRLEIAKLLPSGKTQGEAREKEVNEE